MRPYEDIDMLCSEKGWSLVCWSPLKIETPRGTATGELAWELLRLAEVEDGWRRVLYFGELRLYERFIAFPTPGDDSGHGGLRGSSYLFEKISSTSAEKAGDPLRVSNFFPSTPVLRIIDKE